ncbi:MAG: phage capsid protein [Desulfamplus sp.]
MTINASYFEQVSQLLLPALKQRGSVLRSLVTEYPVVGDSEHIRAFDVGPASFLDEAGGETKFTSVDYSRRLLKPRTIQNSISISDEDMRKQYLQDPAYLASEISASLGVLLDRDIIVPGLQGIAKVSTDKTYTDVALPAENTIAYNVTNLDNSGNLAEGLTPSKVSLAVSMLQQRFNSPNIYCVASSYILAQLRAHERSASALFNSQQAMQSGIMGPYAGVLGFFPCEQLPKKVGDTTIEYAYVFCPEKIFLGIGADISMKAGEASTRNFNTIIQVKGSFDCVRMDEKSVIRIECKNTK